MAQEASDSVVYTKSTHIKTNPTRFEAFRLCRTFYSNWLSKHNIFNDLKRGNPNDTASRFILYSMVDNT